MKVRLHPRIPQTPYHTRMKPQRVLILAATWAEIWKTTRVMDLTREQGYSHGRFAGCDVRAFSSYRFANGEVRRCDRAGECLPVPAPMQSQAAAAL